MPSHSFKITESGHPPLDRALREIIAEFPNRFTTGAPARKIRFVHQPATVAQLSVHPEGEEILITYSVISAAIRALALVMANPERTREETSSFLTRGVMIDASRNAVPKVETLKYYLRRMALMGLNRLYLYCEDTYEVPSEPLFGYFRGRYKQAELKEIDDYADLMGIELILCIQTLGHFEQVLQWPRFAEFRDTNRVLLAEHPKTYDLIERMLDAASCLRSKRIHIGLDEADGAGAGHYRAKYGIRSPKEVLLPHLETVVALCKARGLEPMIWSDMYIRLGKPTEGYYGAEFTVSPEIIQQIPEGVQFVYWDYYHKDAKHYANQIAHHRQLGQEPVFSPCIWNAKHFVTLLDYTVATMGPGMEAARAAGLTEAMATIWGDDGVEYDIHSTLPGLQYFAETCFEGGLPEAQAHFQATTDADWEARTAPARLDVRVVDGKEIDDAGNRSKWILWLDPLLGHLEAHLPPGNREHFGRLACELERLAKERGINTRLARPIELAKALAIKCTMHLDLRPAYQSGDTVRIRQMLEQEIPALSESVERLRKLHYAQWMENNKPFGWEVLDIRYGGILSRLRTLSAVLQDYLDHPGTVIPPLEETPESILPGSEPHDGFEFTWARASTACATVSVGQI